MKKLTFLIIILILAFFYNGHEINEDLIPHSQGNFTIGKLEITEDMRDFFNSKYSTEKEFAVCLNISRAITYDITTLFSKYTIDGIEDKLKYYGKDFSNPSYCENALIHSHPMGSCYFSVGDIRSFKDRIKHGEYYFVVMCGLDRFIYIERNNFNEK